MCKGRESDVRQGLDRAVRQRIETLAYLPTTTSVAMKFIELGKSPEPEPAEYAKVIGSDPALCTKLLALANSSWFGVRNRVTKPNVAVNLLGLGTVRTLAISYCLTGLHNDLRLNPEESRMFWSASLCKAVAAKQFARHFDEKLAEEAFAAGLFQDFALTVMYAVSKEDVLPILDSAAVDWKTRLERECELFRLDHAQVGRMVAEKLELPELFVESVAFHHDHASLRQFIESPVMADAAYAASLFPHVLNAWNPKDAEELRNFVAAHTTAKPLDVNVYLEAVQKELDQLFGYFETGQASETKLTEMLELATREAADNATRLVGTVHSLMHEAASAGTGMRLMMEQQRRLEEAAQRDPLTRALNREGLTERAKDVLKKANRYGLGFAVVYLDLDRFKQLNDTLGHHYGDAGLKKLVEVAQGALRNDELVARLGGDEFVLVLGERSEGEALDLVRGILARLAAEPLNKGESPVRITASAGLLMVPAKSPAQTLEGVLAAADQLMYAAKRAGGNRVHVRGASAAAA